MSCRSKCFQRIFCVLAALLAAPVWAQFNSGVQGTVTDPSGSPVPGVTVTLDNRDTGVRTSATTDQAGFYSITSVVFGRYQIRVEARGFNPTEIPFELNAQQILGVNVKLELSKSSTSITVNEQAPGVNPDEPRLLTTISGSELPSLPLPQRSTLQILQLAPGVVSSGQPSIISNIPIGAQSPPAIANGRPATSNLYRLDGNSIMDTANYGNLNLIPNPDMVSQTVLATSDFTADTGATSSLVTDFTTKSGTNQFHGDIDGTYSSKAFEAHQWNSGVAAPFTQKWLSGGLGGPIIKNRTFFFGSAETQVIQNSGSGSDTYESNDFYNWALGAIPNQPFITKFAAARPTRDQFTNVKYYASDLFPANGASGPACGQVSTQFMPCNLPLIDQGIFNQSPRLPGTQYNIRLDQYFRNAQDRIFLNYFRVDQTSDFFSPRPDFDSETPSHTDFASVNWVHTISPNLLNEAQFGWNRYAFIFGGTGTNKWIDAPFIMTACCPAPNYIFFGYFPPTIDPGGTNQKDHAYRFRDYADWLTGRHRFRFGFEASHEDYWQDQAAFYARPWSVSYTNFWNMIISQPTQYTLYSVSAQTGQFIPQTFGGQVTQFAGYVEDTWKVRPNLTLTLGLRWDDFGNPYNYGTRSQPYVNIFVNGSNLNSTAAWQNALVNTSYTRFVQHPFAGRQNVNFEPRLGFAWAASKDQKTVVRGGFGLYEDALNLNQVTANLPTQPPNRLTLNLNSSNPNLPPPGQTPWGTSTTYPYGFNYPPISLGGFDSRGGVLYSNGKPIQASINGIDPNLVPQKTGIWNIAVERQLPAQVVFGVTYSGSYSWDLFGGPNYNLEPFQQQLTGSTPGLTPEWGSIQYLRNFFTSNYNALIISAQQNLGRLHWQASYTWSHALGDQFYPNSKNLIDLTYGNQSFDVRNRFSFGGTYEFRSPQNALWKAVGGGWTIGSIAIAQTGLPFTVTNGNTYLGDGQGSCTCGIPNLGPGLLQTAGFSRAQFEAGIFPNNSFVAPAALTEGNEGVYSLRNPGFLEFDVSVSKKTVLPWFGDRTSAFTVRADALNVLNRVNLSGIDTTLGDANFGKSTSAGLPRYYQLGARFEF